MTKPLIGICTDHVRHFPSPDRDRSYLKLYPQYCNAIIAGGGTPLVIPIVPDVQDIKPLLGLVQGVMLVGSDDYPAEWFGGKTLPTDVPVTPERATFDRAFVQVLYDETELPVFAICGGMQLTAIFSGGTLIQDLPSQPLEHRAGKDGFRKHTVSIEAGSVLERVFGASEVEVNSLHHQAVESVGERLIVSARAPDGVIEAIEFKDHPFRIGVQWHPERMDDSNMRKLFAAFVAEARKGLNVVA
ncbi:MAG: gamma-glutamyl-gamma-aminobutyrate hydrolase family protein [Planctomycetes bacterium]|nr:gamma-glutamyl-gamma-aminobutyrate hydrolase family protein [Planctomycetota bacterium]